MRLPILMSFAQKGISPQRRLTASRSLSPSSGTTPGAALTTGTFCVGATVVARLQRLGGLDAQLFQEVGGGG